MRTRLWSILGGVVCLCACMGTPPPEAKAELAEPAAAAEVDRAVAPQDEFPRGECDAVPEGMRRLSVPLNHTLEHFERGDRVDVVFVAELIGQAIQREDTVAMPLVSGARVACVREGGLELLLTHGEVPLLAASKAHGVFYAVERAEGDDEAFSAHHETRLNMLMEHYISHEAKSSSRGPVKVYGPRNGAYSLAEFEDHEPGTVLFTLPLEDPARVEAGERVDVILGTQVPSRELGRAQMEPAGIVFAQMAKVEAVGEASVSLLVTRELALSLAVSDGHGAWSLSVRAPGDGAIHEPFDVRLKEHLINLEVIKEERVAVGAAP